MMKTAFITPSYRGDFERCRLLCESTTRFLPDGVEHILLIDRRDMTLFSSLENLTVRVVEAESLMPWWIFRVPGFSRWRANLFGLPVRGWIYQQLLKISSTKATNADILQFVDSDVTLIRPVDISSIIRADGLVRLQHTSFESEQHRQWLASAIRLLGVKNQTVTGNFVGNFITWRRANVLLMTERIADLGFGSWTQILSSRTKFSEYMLYGAFVTEVQGIENSGHFIDSSPNLSTCWDFDVRTKLGMQRFFESVPSDSMGVMIHSKYGIAVSDYRHHIERLWAQAASA